jgi:hypothetical protein
LPLIDEGGTAVGSQVRRNSGPLQRGGLRAQTGRIGNNRP